MIPPGAGRRSPACRTGTFLDDAPLDGLGDASGRDRASSANCSVERDDGAGFRFSYRKRSFPTEPDGVSDCTGGHSEDGHVQRLQPAQVTPPEWDGRKGVKPDGRHLRATNGCPWSVAHRPIASAT
jgi:hypothetical protein